MRLPAQQEAKVSLRDIALDDDLLHRSAALREFPFLMWSMPPREGASLLRKGRNQFTARREQQLAAGNAPYEKREP
uniref:hypothetical protein n=1 Tax=Burkholderia arboris TaxID=488730 RepID=UPI003BEF3F9C